MDNSDKFEKVYSVGNSVTADLLVGILQNNGIAAFKQGDGPIGGNLRKIYTKKSGNIHVFSKLCSQLQKNKFTRFSFWYKISLPTNFTKRGVL